MREYVQVQIEAKQLVWQFRRSAQGNWVASCESLGQAVQSEHFADIHARIFETMNALMFDLFEDGELEAFLKKQGWRVAQPIPASVPAGIAFDVPYELMAAKNAQARAGA